MVIKIEDKNTPWNEEWIKNVKILSNHLNGEETDETKQKSKILEKVLAEKDQLEIDEFALEKKIKQKQDEIVELDAVTDHLTNAQSELTKFNTGGDKSDWREQLKEFRGKDPWTGATATNSWQTNGWDALVENHYPADYTDNLYKVAGQTFTITEDEVVRTLAKFIYELGKISTTDFNSKHSKTGIEQTAIENYFAHIHNQSQAITELNSNNSPKLGEKKLYDLPDTYQKNGNLYERTNFDNVFSLLDKLDDTLIDKLATAGSITKLENWKIAKSCEAYTPAELENFGIKLQDPTKTKIYKSTKKVSGIYVKDEHKFEVKEGLKDWVKLVKMIFADADNRTKIKKSFSTTDVNYLLFQDLTSWNGSTNSFNSGSHNYKLPENANEIDELVRKLTSEQSTNSIKKTNLVKEIEAREKELKTKQELKIEKAKEANSLVEELVTYFEEDLKKYNIDKPFTKVDDNNDNRKTPGELQEIKRNIEILRYLKNGDIEISTCNEQQDQVLTEINKLEKAKSSGQYSLINYFTQVLSFDKNIPNTFTNYQKGITALKTGKYTDESGKEHNLMYKVEEFKKTFEEYEKLFKLYPQEETAYDLIKNIGSDLPPNQPEKLVDWQTKLKELDPELDDNIITEDWKTKWANINNHKTIAEIETLIKKVIGDDKKLKTEFLTEIQKTDIALTDLKTLLGKEPKEVITYIVRYEHNNLDDSDEDEKNKKKTQQERRIKKALKDADANFDITKDLDDTTLNNSLYKISIGEITIDNTKYYKSDLTEITSGDDEENDKNKKQKEEKWLRTNNWQVYAVFIGITAVVGVACCWIWWEKLKRWWNGPQELGDEEIKLESDDE